MAGVRYVVNRLDSKTDFNGLIANMARTHTRGGLELRLNASRIFPNAAVPVAAALSLYRQLNYPLRVTNISPEVEAARVWMPLRPTPSMMEGKVLSQVWEYRTEQEAMLLCRAFIEALSDHAVCSEGVVDSLNWCLYEVMDNVFQHSHASSGFAMMQVHVKSRMCAVTIADSGIGVHRSFIEGGVHKTPDAYEALKLAVQEKVTSKSKNMGNGLFGLIRVVGLNGGKLEIRSGRGVLEYRDAQLSGSASNSTPVLELNDHHGTFVNWELDVRKPVHLAEALGTPNRPNFRLEDIENDQGRHEVLVAEFEEGLGTRKSAEQVRTRLQNILSEGVSRLSISFEGVNIVSSSFADEVLGKLALSMGLIEFMRRFELTNMNPTVEAIVERAISQRIEEGDDSTPGAPGSWRPTR